MIFHENRLLADDSHEISYLIFFQKLRKMLQKLSTAAVVIGALWFNFGNIYKNLHIIFRIFCEIVLNFFPS